MQARQRPAARSSFLRKLSPRIGDERRAVERDIHGSVADHLARGFQFPVPRGLDPAVRYDKFQMVLAAPPPARRDVNGIDAIMTPQSCMRGRRLLRLSETRGSAGNRQRQKTETPGPRHASIPLCGSLCAKVSSAGTPARSLSIAWSEKTMCPSPLPCQACRLHWQSGQGAEIPNRRCHAG